VHPSWFMNFVSLPCLVSCDGNELYQVLDCHAKCSADVFVCSRSSSNETRVSAEPDDVED